jgi:hypothetical protein
VGDVVLLKNETAAGNTYKLERVVEVFRDERDGKVRKVSVAYKNVNKEVFRTSTSHIHKIMLVVPAEDANLPPLPASINPPPDLPVRPDLPALRPRLVLQGTSWPPPQFCRPLLDLM